MTEQENKSDINRIYSIIDNLQQRLDRIENILNLETEGNISNVQTVAIESESSEDMEFRLGEKWFGKIGIIVFLLAVINFIIFPISIFSQTLVLAVGFSISLIMIAGSQIGKEYLKNLAGYIFGGGMILFYLSILRLKYFSSAPIINDQLTIVSLLFLTAIVSMILSLKNKSISLTGISVILICLANLLSNITIIFFSVLIAICLATIVIGITNNWKSFPLTGIILTYFTLLLWTINNPLVTGKIIFVNNYMLTLFFVPIIILIYGIANALQTQETDDGNWSYKISIANSVGGFGLFAIIVLGTNFAENGLLFIVLSIALFVLAILHWKKHHSRLSTFFYSMLAYGSFSLAIIAKVDTQNALILLCWQSLVVVSTALWFRSKFIVVANFFIFIIILLSFVFSADRLNTLTASFGVVALISARVINWQKKRLELKTENLRNAYLLVAFLILPIVIYNNVAVHLVGIALIGLSLFYYIVGKLINNKKYRLLATGNLIIALAYIIIFGFVSEQTAYKVFSFFLASITLIIVSIVYTKDRAKEKNDSVLNQ
jgi:hypothetical protein